MRIRLTDDQIWTILNAPGMTDAQLARALGVKESTVHHRRWLLRRDGDVAWPLDDPRLSRFVSSARPPRNPAPSG